MSSTQSELITPDSNGHLWAVRSCGHAGSRAALEGSGGRNGGKIDVSTLHLN